MLRVILFTDSFYFKASISYYIDKSREAKTDGFNISGCQGGVC